MTSEIVLYVIEFALLLPAIVFHEVSHGYVAYLLGDPTAKEQGRLSLNPLRHIDPWGTLLLPAILLIASGGRAAFGYAKPVQVSPWYFRDRRRGMFLVGIAGPATNLVLAAASGSLSRVVPEGGIAWFVLFYFCLMNLSLMAFNLIPIPPLDGSRVLPLFLGERGLRAYHQVERYGFAILLVVLWGFPTFLRVDPIGFYLDWTVLPLLRLFAGG